VKEHYPLNGESLELDANRCTGCGTCIDVCPHSVFAFAETRGATTSHNTGRTACIASADRCMACGACALNCPAKAIQVASGVGCAAAVINRLLGKSRDCSCGDGIRCC